MGTFPNQGPLSTPNQGTDPSVVAYTPATVSVTTTAGGTSIATVSEDSGPVYLTNGATQIFIGNQGVTTTTGYPVAANATVLVTYGPPAPNFGGVSCQLYGITAAGSSTVTYNVATAWPGAANLPAE